MNQYCFDVTATGEPNPETIKNHVLRLYYKKKFKDLAYTTDDKLPLIVIFSKKDGQVCIKMTSRAKKNVERIEAIHAKLTKADLKVSDTVTLSKPTLFKLEQCEWWDDKCIDKDQGVKWDTLVHNGPYFTHIMEPYKAHGAPLVYDGKNYKLSPAEERIANFYARRIISEEAGNVVAKLTEDAVFNKNFWTDFKKYLSPEHKKIFKDFKKLDFSKIVNKLMQQKELDKQMTAAQKNIKKVRTAERKQDYGYAVINGVKEPVGNFTIEPAAIFYGRGENPKRGKIKRDIDPEEVTINVQEGVTVKPPAGHNWKNVIHDHKAAWIANWKDPISNENKYVYLGAEGQLKGKSDYIKYEKARKLNKFLENVRKKYTADITSRVRKLKQLGTVLYFIDNYGLRVGNEKDESETDTVGASTLRVEHVKLKPPKTVVFDFLGKDSIRYYKELEVTPDVYHNVELFLKSKKPTDPLFNLISATDINNYLKTFDKDFSAKVFRTRLASTIMSNALNELRIKETATADEKKKMFTKANIKVAEVLNHQRTVSAKAKELIKKYEQELKDLRKLLRDTKASGKSTKAIETRIQKKKDQIENKKDTLNVAITTSLTNYIDPRIVVGWAKKNEMTIPKVYTATLQRKFKWAIDMTQPEWSYKDTELLPVMAKLQPTATITKGVAKKITTASKTTTTRPTVKKATVKTVAVRPAVKKPVAPKTLAEFAKTKQPVKKQVAPKTLAEFAKTKKIETTRVEKKVEKLPSVAYVVYNPTYSSIIGIYSSDKVMGDFTVGKGFNVVLKVPVNTFFDGIDERIIFTDPDYLLKDVEVDPTRVDLGERVYIVYDSDIKSITGVYASRKLAQDDVFSGGAFVMEIPTNYHFATGIKEEYAINKPDYISERVFLKKPAVSIVDYSPKSFAVIGDTKGVKDELKDLGGRYNPNLNINDEKKPGWIFAKKHLESVRSVLGMTTDDDSESVTLENLGENDRRIIQCFAKDESVISFLKDDLLSGRLSHKVYTDEFLKKFIECTEEETQDLSSRVEIVEHIVKDLKPSSVATYLFLVYLLHKVSVDLRKEYLKSLLERVKDKSTIQQCLA